MLSLPDIFDSPRPMPAKRDGNIVNRPKRGNHALHRVE